MRMIHSVVIREKPPSKRPRKQSRSIFFDVSADCVDDLELSCVSDPVACCELWVVPRLVFEDFDWVLGIGVEVILMLLGVGGVSFSMHLFNSSPFSSTVTESSYVILFSVSIIAYSIESSISLHFWTDPFSILGCQRYLIFHSWKFLY